MAKNNRKCVICGTEYSYCPKCGVDVDKPAWMSLFHDKNCLKIYSICSEYGAGKILVDEAKSQLSNCNLNGISISSESTREIISKINNEGKVIVNKVKVDDVDKNKINEKVDEKVEDKVDEVLEIKNTNKSTKFENNYREKKYFKKEEI